MRPDATAQSLFSGSAITPSIAIKRIISLSMVTRSVSVSGIFTENSLLRSQRARLRIPHSGYSIVRLSAQEPNFFIGKFIINGSKVNKAVEEFNIIH